MVSEVGGLQQDAFDTKTVVIVGSGPAGCTAAIYLKRALYSPMMFTGMSRGGQLSITTDVENYPGFAEPIMGPELMENMLAQCKNQGVKILELSVDKIAVNSLGLFETTYDGGQKKMLSRAVIIASGAEAKWLGLDSEAEFRGYGVSACATCDGFFFRSKKVIVVGGGNTAFEEALYLSNLALEVILVHRSDKYRAELILQKKLAEKPNVKFLTHYTVRQFFGSFSPKKVQGVILDSVKDGKELELEIDGAFIAIGHTPITSFLPEELTLLDSGIVFTNPDSTRTNINNLYAAGDVADDKFRQAVTAAGLGCMAALEAIDDLENG